MKSRLVEFMVPISTLAGNSIYELLTELEMEGHLEILPSFQISTGSEFLIIPTKIPEEFLLVMKLKYPTLVECMNVSYISNDLKDKYRK